MRVQKFYFLLFILLLLQPSSMLFYNNKTTIKEQNEPLGYTLKFRNNNNPHSALVDILLNTIVLWSGSLDSIPPDWVLCNGLQGTPNLTGKFVYGVMEGEDPGASGGAIEHNHTYEKLVNHTHGITDLGHSHQIYAPSSFDSADSWLTGDPVVIDIATVSQTSDESTGITLQLNGTKNCKTDTSSSLPPYYKIAYIMKKTSKALLPAGIIFMWNDSLDSIPEGWVLCNGTNGTPNLTNRFVYGVMNGENPGDTGGKKVHNHTYDDLPLHSHEISDPKHNHGYSQYITFPGVFSRSGGYDCVTGFYIDPSSSKETSDITINAAGKDFCETKNNELIPPYYKTAYIMNQQDTAIIPNGTILIWSNKLDNIQEGLIFCNGSYETPDLRERLTLGVIDNENPGSIGGFKEHKHLYSDLPSHIHEVNDPGHDHAYVIPAYYSVTSGGFTSPINPTTTIASDTSPTGITIQYNGTEDCVTDNSSSLPPYYKVAFLMNNKTFTIYKESAFIPNVGGDDDDDDDNEDVELLIPVIIIVGLISVIGIISVVIILIKKAIIGGKRG